MCGTGSSPMKRKIKTMTIDLATVVLLVLCAELGRQLLRQRAAMRRDAVRARILRLQSGLTRLILRDCGESPSGTLSNSDRRIVRQLMSALDALWIESAKRRTGMLNFPEFRRFALDYKKASGEIIPSAPPENPELRALCEDAARALVLAFFARASFLPLEIALRLGAKFFKEQAANFTRPLRDAERFGVKVGMFGGAASA